VGAGPPVVEQDPLVEQVAAAPAGGVQAQLGDVVVDPEQGLGRVVVVATAEYSEYAASPEAPCQWLRNQSNTDGSSNRLTCLPVGPS
jgi:hypothetical protein